MKNIIKIVIGVALIILGIWVIFTDEPLLQNILKFSGLILMIFGAVQLLLTITKNNFVRQPGDVIPIACMNILLGLIFFVAADVIMSALNLFLGIWIAAIGVIKVSVKVSMNQGFHFKENIIGILCFIIGVLVITTPVLTITTIKIVFGIFLIICGAVNLLINFYGNRKETLDPKTVIIEEPKPKKKTTNKDK